MNSACLLARRLMLLTVLAAAGLPVFAQSAAVPEKTRENLMAVVRESRGANKLDEVLTPTGNFKARLPDGTEVDVDAATWEFIGDMHIRLVFDGPQSMIGATRKDIAQLGIGDVDEALALAVSNVRRVYGEPAAEPWTAGLMQVQGKSPDLDSSYILDRAYWRRLAQAHPEGLVVAVPKRGGLLYAPLADTMAVSMLKNTIGRLHGSSGRHAVSSALYLFQGGKWSVFQPPAVKP